MNVVVEVVGDASGQHAERFDPLGVGELFAEAGLFFREPGLFGDVAADQHQQNLPAHPDRGKGAGEHNATGGFFIQHTPELHRLLRHTAEMHDPAVKKPDARIEQLVDQLGWILHAEQLSRRDVGVDDPAGGIQHDDQLAGILQHHPVAVLPFAQVGLQLLGAAVAADEREQDVQRTLFAGADIDFQFFQIDRGHHSQPDGGDQPRDEIAVKDGALQTDGGRDSQKKRSPDQLGNQKPSADAEKTVQPDSSNCGFRRAGGPARRPAVPK